MLSAVSPTAVTGENRDCWRTLSVSLYGREWSGDLCSRPLDSPAVYSDHSFIVVIRSGALTAHDVSKTIATLDGKREPGLEWKSTEETRSKNQSVA